MNHPISVTRIEGRRAVLSGLTCLALAVSISAATTPAHALSASVNILGVGPVSDSAGDQVVSFAVDVVFNYPLKQCVDDPTCNDKSVFACVNYQAVAESATAGVDFVAASGQLSGTLLFHEPGEQPLGQIDVTVLGDDLVEGPETFKVVLRGTTQESGCPSEANLGNREARATIVDGEPQLPDLAVTGLRRTEGCGIQIKIQNVGTGELPDVAYDSVQGASIQMQRNGGPWGGIRLDGLDPLKALQTPGGEVAHVWFPNADNLRLPPGRHRLSVTVDQANSVLESNEGNNTRTRQVVCAVR